MQPDLEQQPEKLCIIWSSRDPEVARNLVFMYGGNALPKGWWKEVTLVVWGPSQQMLAFDAATRKELTLLQERGVHIIACRACAERYNLTAVLEEMGLEVDYVGAFFTSVLKSREWSSVTF
jgi:hypothetical protein